MQTVEQRVQECRGGECEHTVTVGSFVSVCLKSSAICWTYLPLAIIVSARVPASSAVTWVRTSERGEHMAQTFLSSPTTSCPTYIKGGMGCMDMAQAQRDTVEQGFSP